LKTIYSKFEEVGEVGIEARGDIKFADEGNFKNEFAFFIACAQEE